MEPRALYPVRAPVPWAEEGGEVVVLLPKRLGPVGRGLRAVVQGPSHLRVPLGPLGSRAFHLADGSRTAGDLASQLQAEFGDRAGPAERALGYVADLARNGILRLAEAPVPPPPPPDGPLRAVACAACGRAFHAADPPGTRLRCPSCRRPVRA